MRKISCSFYAASGIASVLTLSSALAAPDVTAQAVQKRPVFRFDTLRDPLTVSSVVQERDGGSLCVSLVDATGRKDVAFFSSRRGSPTAGRLYVDEWLVPLRDPVEKRVIGAIHRSVDSQFTPDEQSAIEKDDRKAAAGYGQRGFWASRLLQAVTRLRNLSDRSIRPITSP
jgi:hypothetical protein